MLEKGNTVTVPVQKHRQVIFDVFLGEIVRQLVEIQHSLRNLQSVVIDSTIRVLSQAEFLCEKGNTIPKFRYGLNGLVQVCIGHGVLWCRVTGGGVKGSPSSLHFINERYIVNSIMVMGWSCMALAFSPK